ncbi:hypothetical protein [Mycolicibacterium pulveris]|uniref:hypothetical protein n=1 Tax=Mycolicibacterium pulveris TaxID=36813 RepID=UPI003CF63CFD
MKSLTTLAEDGTSSAVLRLPDLEGAPPVPINATGSAARSAGLFGRVTFVLSPAGGSGAVNPNGANVFEASSMGVQLLATTLSSGCGVIGGMTVVVAMAAGELSGFTGVVGGGGAGEPVLGTARTPAAITTVAMDLCGEMIIAGPPSASPELS